MGIVKNVYVLCGKTKYPTDFLLLKTPQDSFYPIVFGRPFLNNSSTMVDCLRGKFSIKFGDDKIDFSFSKFANQPDYKELPQRDEIELIASIGIPLADPLEQYLLDQEGLANFEERQEIEDVFLSPATIVAS